MHEPAPTIVREQRVRALLDRIDSLPPLPPVARELLALGDLEAADIERVASLIELDPGLSANVLAICRAAYTGLGDRIRSVRHAVVMLGTECLNRLVLSAQVCEMLREQAAALDDSGRTGDARGFDREGFWVHCISVACAAEVIARRAPGRIKPDRAFLAGLLHGIGRLALELVAPRAVSQIALLAEASCVRGSAAERRVMGLDLHEAGRRLGERWDLPADVVAVISLHDGPAHAILAHPDRRLILSVMLAKWLCRRYHLGWSGDWGAPGDMSGPMRGMGVDQPAVEACLPEIFRSCRERIADLGFAAPACFDAAGPDLGMAIANQANRRLDALEKRRLRRAARADSRAVPATPGDAQPA